MLNKIDLPAADVDRVSKEIISLLGCAQEELLQISAKTGVGTKDVLKAIVEKVPPPKGEIDAPLTALIFDSYYDDYRGVILFVRIRDGIAKKEDQITMMAENSHGIALEMGALKPDLSPLAN